MKYTEFEDLISSARMREYITACGNDTRKAMKLYRLNLKLSQEMFTVISCFEVILRNKIDKVMQQYFGNDRLRDSVANNGIFFSDNRVEQTRKIITKAYNELVREKQLFAYQTFVPNGVWSMEIYVQQCAVSFERTAFAVGFSKQTEIYATNED